MAAFHVRVVLGRGAVARADARRHLGPLPGRGAALVRQEEAGLKARSYERTYGNQMIVTFGFMIVS